MFVSVELSRFRVVGLAILGVLCVCVCVCARDCGFRIGAKVRSLVWSIYVRVGLDGYIRIWGVEASF